MRWMWAWAWLMAGVFAAGCSAGSDSVDGQPESISSPAATTSVATPHASTDTPSNVERLLPNRPPELSGLLIFTLGDEVLYYEGADLGGSVVEPLHRHRLGPNAQRITPLDSRYLLFTEWEEIKSLDLLTGEVRVHASLGACCGFRTLRDRTLLITHTGTGSDRFHTLTVPDGRLQTALGNFHFARITVSSDGGLIMTTPKVQHQDWQGAPRTLWVYATPDLETPIIEITLEGDDLIDAGAFSPDGAWFTYSARLDGSWRRYARHVESGQLLELEGRSDPWQFDEDALERVAAGESDELEDPQSEPPGTLIARRDTIALTMDHQTVLIQELRGDDWEIIDRRALLSNRPLVAWRDGAVVDDLTPTGLRDADAMWFRRTTIDGEFRAVFIDMTDGSAFEVAGPPEGDPAGPQLGPAGISSNGNLVLLGASGAEGSPAIHVVTTEGLHLARELPPGTHSTVQDPTGAYLLAVGPERSVIVELATATIILDDLPGSTSRALWIDSP